MYKRQFSGGVFGSISQAGGLNGGGVGGLTGQSPPSGSRPPFHTSNGIHASTGAPHAAAATTTTTQNAPSGSSFSGGVFGSISQAGGLNGDGVGGLTGQSPPSGSRPPFHTSNGVHASTGGQQAGQPSGGSHNPQASSGPPFGSQPSTPFSPAKFLQKPEPAHIPSPGGTPQRIRPREARRGRK